VSPYRAELQLADDGTGEVDLIPGPYFVTVAIEGGFVRHSPVEIGVPDVASAALGELVNTGPVAEWPDVLTARDQAQAAAQTATAQASAAAQSATAAEDFAEAVFAAGHEASVYFTISQGIAETEPGDQFIVPSTGANIRYRHDAGGVAAEVSRSPAVKDPVFTGSITVSPHVLSDDAADSWILRIRDNEGNALAGVTQEGLSAMIGAQFANGASLRGDAMSASLLRLLDAANVTRFDISPTGHITGAGLTVDGGAMIADLDDDAWQFCLSDREGNIAFGIGADGRLFGIGDFTDAPTNNHAVRYAFAEPYRDPSENLLLTWVSTTASARVIEYRAAGGTIWQQASSRRTRAFPNVAGLWLHTAVLANLAPQTVYDLRVPGSNWTDIVRTCPRSNVRVCVASDYQRYSFGADTILAEFGAVFSGESADMLIFNGDFVDDDGRFEPVYGERWNGFMEGLSLFWRNSGALVPICGVMANHEARNVGGTSNATFGGNGTPGQMPQIFSFGYDPDDTDFVNPSAWSFSIGREVAFVAVESDHTVPFDSQLGWFSARLAEYAPNVRHLNSVWHAPAFYARNATWETYSTQARTAKRLFWPALQAHAAKVRAAWVGHEHNIVITARLRTDWDVNRTEAQNDARWITDPVGGVRQLGSGMTGGSIFALTPGVYDQVSSIDSSTKTIAALGWDGTNFTTHGAINSSGAQDGYNVWMADYSSTQFVARCIGRDGHIFYTITETI
jgi:hypothetical protein